jgi:hypothetical protein
MRTSNMRLPHVGQAGRVKTLGGLAVIVAILIPTNKQKHVTPKFRLKSKTSEPAPFRKDSSSIFLFISCIAKLDYAQTFGSGAVV